MSWGLSEPTVRVRLLVILALAATFQSWPARADLASFPSDAPAPLAAVSTEGPGYICRATNHAGPGDLNWLVHGKVGGPFGSAVPHLLWPLSPRQIDDLAAGRFAPAANGPNLVATPLPPGPNGFALGLSALTSLAAVQACRSFRKLHLSTRPEWYHTGGPTQVGHATPYQLDRVPLAVCDLEQPSDLRPGVSYRIPRELRSRLRPQFFFIVESPRAPPIPA